MHINGGNCRQKINNDRTVIGCLYALVQLVFHARVGVQTTICERPILSYFLCIATNVFKSLEYMVHSSEFRDVLLKFAISSQGWARIRKVIIILGVRSALRVCIAKLTVPAESACRSVATVSGKSPQRCTEQSR